MLWYFNFISCFFFVWFTPGSCLKAIKQQGFNILQSKATLPSTSFFYFKGCKILHSKMFQWILKLKQTNFCCFMSIEKPEILVPLANMRICLCVISVIYCLIKHIFFYCILHSLQNIKINHPLKIEYPNFQVFFSMIVGIVCLKKLHESGFVCGSYETKAKENLIWENVLFSFQTMGESVLCCIKIQMEQKIGTIF